LNTRIPSANPLIAAKPEMMYDEPVVT